MTDEHDTTDDGSIVRSRRTVLAATFGIPVVGSVGIGAADAVNRFTASDLATAGSIDGTDSAADVAVDFAGDRHPISREQYTAVTADPQLLDDLGVSVGDQLRLRRGDEHALYTVTDSLNEEDASAVRMARLARARLDVANTVWADVGDFGEGCPTLVGASDLVDQRFDAVADPTVVSEKSVSEASTEGGLIERSDGDGSELAILAPHGGDIEPHTEEQAKELALETACSFSLWRAMGYSPGGGAFLRWHVPSTEVSPASFPALGELAGDDYDYAISFHGICANQIRVGGGAPESVKAKVTDTINWELPEDAPDAVVDTGRFSATSDDVLVNSVSDNGVWLGQPPEARADHREAVVDAVSTAFEDLL